MTTTTEQQQLTTTTTRTDESSARPAQQCAGTAAAARFKPIESFTLRDLPFVATCRNKGFGQGCKQSICRLVLFRPGRDYLAALRLRHPEWEQDRDKHLKAASKRKRREVVYPREGVKLYERWCQGDIQEGELERMDQCILDEFYKLVETHKGCK